MLKSLFCEDISVDYEFKSVKFKGGIDGIDRLKNERRTLFPFRYFSIHAKMRVLLTYSAIKWV